MTLTLPEALLLFSLRDDRGTVHSAAFLALDPALRGAVLAELKLQGHVQVRSNGALRWREGAGKPTHPLLLDGYTALSQVTASAGKESTVADWLAILADKLFDLRLRVVTVLERRNILKARDREMAWSGDSEIEAAVRDRLFLALDAQDAVSPRDGILIGLVVACHLGEVVFGPRAREATARAAWVSERDAIVRAVGATIAEIEGAW